MSEEKSPKMLELEQKLKELELEEHYHNSESNIKHRARSVSIGCCGGGMIEINLRGHFDHMYYITNPVEAVELIGQLAAASGVEVAIRPKEDFASWRSWDTNLPSGIEFMGTAPYQLTEERRKYIGEAKNKHRKAMFPVDSEERKLLDSTSEIKKPKKKKKSKITESKFENNTDD